MADFSNFNFDPFQTDFTFGFQNPVVAPTEPSGPPVLGLILVEMGALATEQLDEAVALQRDQGVPLAQVLLEGGYCTQDQVMMALRSRPQYG